MILDVPLRRGAWYQVQASTPLEVAITAYGRTVTIPAPYIELRTTPPREWTALLNPTVAPRTPKQYRRGYLVCPGCQNRVVLPPNRVQEQMCPRCSMIYAIAWDERYLEKAT